MALAAAATALGLAALEMLARMVERTPGAPLAAGYTQADPLLGWRHRPRARVPSAQGEYVINSMGLRDRERTYGVTPGVRRVMVLGDSFAEGFSVRGEQAVAAVVERALAARGCRVEALNAGTVGYSTDQEYLFYREEGSRYAPAVVALFFYYNDVLYNARESVGPTPKPLFTFTGGVPRVKTAPLPPGAPFPGGAPPSRRRGSAGVRWLRERLATSAPGVYDALARVRFWSPLPRETPPLEMLVYAREPPAEIGRAWAHTEQILRLMQQETQRHRARLVLVYVPSKMEVSERDWRLTRRRFGVDDAKWDRRRVTALLQHAGARMGFPVLDPTAELRAADHGWLGGPYHARGGHWNALGHRVVGERLADYIAREGWVGECR